MIRYVNKITLIVFISFFALSSWTIHHSLAEDQEQIKDFILYENIKKIDVQPEERMSLQGMNVYEDGHFTFVNEGITWNSTNENVATVDQDGQVEWTGQPGRTYIEASNGAHQDRIAFHHRPEQAGGSEIIKETDDRHALIDDAINGMKIEEKIGQMLMPDFRTWNGENVTEMLPEIEQIVKDYHLGGVILFAENVETTAQTAELVADYQAASEKYGMLTTIDQEGGTVTRLQSGTDMPGNMALGAGNDVEMTSKVGGAIGAELESLGINMNLAPTVDVNNNPDNPVIGVRSFGEDPSLVADHGVAYMDGMQESGTAVTAKHFPGHGDTDVDSHVGLPEIPHDRDRLFDVELPPFQAAMDNDVDAIMTAHVTFPEIDSSTVISKETGEEITIPATLSEEVLTGLMREEMGYEGVIYTDALNMDAIDEHFEPVDAAIRAVQAGSDIVLMPVGLEDVAHGLLEAVNNKEISEERIEASVERILELKLKRGIVKEENPTPVEEKIAQAEEIVGAEEHLEVEKQAAEQGVTLVKNEGDVLPLNLDEDESVVVIGDEYVKQLSDAIEAHHSEVEAIELPESEDFSEGQWQMIQQADKVIAGTYSADNEAREVNHPQMEMVRSVQEEVNTPLISIGIRNPYDVMAYPEVEAYLAQYGLLEANFKATANILFGETEPVGQLPVTIPTVDGGVLYEAGHGLSYERREEGET
ncbi:beta-N-acetylhexosaminidase [Geomicrobium halophilum]|uniref:beta-N-acetylhexosaminidase n=1 Tax=Geomicrobium halophilum TaxID=549000 RepID=A0A841PZQ3_9BACL|nr:glycoside hydrolase family 3 protein [Geomicrobium halophilum]MBB6450533.1 beta-N-acetylhexosaminidase [Geomicrobium halophilum]